MTEQIDEDSLKALQQSHAELEGRIAKEESRPSPDTMSISEWKKEKLRLKDRITNWPTSES